MATTILEGLNDIQKQAVETTEGSLLILAGAGTGKTKVLTTRVVNILNKNLAKSYQILAVTFTNKAAREMRERIESLLGYPIDGFWIGTFHSIGLRILRRHTSEVGLKPNFTILDTADCERILKEILLSYNIDIKKFYPSMLLNTISRLKDKNILSDNVPPQEDKMIGSHNLSSIYTQYQARLKELNSVDFGDLILLCVDLFRQFPDILALWQEKFRYLLIDEFQDTNTLQYVFVRLLSLKHNNLCCVGDDDQSIYSWRGAEINNILRFEEDFPNTIVLRLEQNYRSTTPILKVASSLISKNKERWEKTLWTNNEGELLVKVHEAFNSKSEADFIATTIENLYRKGVAYSNIAILVRAAYQTRELEERLKFYSLPYRFVGGTEFYNRLEIKDMIAYIRLLYQKYDDMAFLRIINTPKRSLGEASITKIRTFARENNLSLFQASSKIIATSILSGKAKIELTKFVELFEKLEIDLENLELSSIVQILAEDSGYIAMWELENTQEAKARIENIKELYTAIKNYETIEDFLEYISLVSDKEDNSDNNKVSIMTLHAAKGLEFDRVFLTGWEEGILPSQKSLEESGEKGLQEERRLAYVGITRAKKELFISYSLNRQIYGSWQSCVGSRFLEEVNHSYIEKIESRNSSYQSSNIMKDSYLREKLYNETTSSSKNKAIIVGSRVKHINMGEGTVFAVQGPIIDVHFDSGDRKKIMISFLSIL